MALTEQKTGPWQFGRPRLMAALICLQWRAGQSRALAGVSAPLEPRIPHRPPTGTPHQIWKWTKMYGMIAGFEITMRQNCERIFPTACLFLRHSNI